MKEIERKFLVHSSVKTILPTAKKFSIQQGYLQRSKECTVRIRIKNEIGYLTIKGASTNFSRDEFEYEIPLEDARQMLLLCGNHVMEKFRYEILHEGKTWEIDEFLGKLQGLYLAEIELENEAEEFERPSWLADEVSLDPQFTNSNLVAIASLADLNL